MGVFFEPGQIWVLKTGLGAPKSSPFDPTRADIHVMSVRPPTQTRGRMHTANTPSTVIIPYNYNGPYSGPYI